MINNVYRSGRLYGYRFGVGGKVYSIDKYGHDGAIKRADKQGRATYSRSGVSRVMSMYKLPKTLRRRKR